MLEGDRQYLRGDDPGRHIMKVMSRQLAAGQVTCLSGQILDARAIA